MAGRSRITVEHVADIDESPCRKYCRERHIFRGRSSRAMFQCDLDFIAQPYKIGPFIRIGQGVSLILKSQCAERKHMIRAGIKKPGLILRARWRLLQVTYRNGDSIAMPRAARRIDEIDHAIRIRSQRGIAGRGRVRSVSNRCGRVAKIGIFNYRNRPDTYPGDQHKRQRRHQSYPAHSTHQGLALLWRELLAVSLILLYIALKLLIPFRALHNISPLSLQLASGHSLFSYYMGQYTMSLLCNKDASCGNPGQP